MDIKIRAIAELRAKEELVKTIRRLERKLDLVMDSLKVKYVEPEGDETASPEPEAAPVREKAPGPGAAHAATAHGEHARKK